MNRSIVRMVRGVAMAGALSLPMVASAQAKPIIVIWPSDNNSIGKNAADFKGVEKGIEDLLITDLAASGKVRVVDRTNLNKILDEQNLAKSGAVDPTTAVNVGKILGACYAITGGFMDLGNGTMTLTARMISMETTQVDPNTVKVTKKTDDVMGLIDEMSTKIQAQLRLTGCPTGAPPRSGSTAPAQQGGATKAPAATPAATPAAPVDQYAKVLTDAQKTAFVATKLDMKTALLYSKGLDAMDNKDPKKAAQLFQQVLTAAPGFAPAADNLKKANGAGH